MIRSFKRSQITLLCAFGLCAVASGAQNPFVGYWELTVPGGGPGWLGVEEEEGRLQANILWIGGSVVPTASARVEDGKLVITREHVFQSKDASGKTVKKRLTETITATREGDKLSLTTVKPRENGSGEDRAAFSGKRTPPMPAAPELAGVKFGEAVILFNGKDLSGWRLTDPNAVNGWSVENGVLVNMATQEEGKPHKNYGNLRTDREFEDFNLKLEVRPQKGENSGVYLRGIYEVQVADTYGRPLDSHNMGGIYSRIKPTVSAEKPPGEWQTMDITLVKRHATVVLNGKKIIDNQPVLGCTGGALWSDVSRAGPIYLQGDHTGIEYRNLILRPVIN